MITNRNRAYLLGATVMTIVRQIASHATARRSFMLPMLILGLVSLVYLRIAEPQIQSAPVAAPPAAADTGVAAWTGALSVIVFLALFAFFMIRGLRLQRRIGEQYLRALQQPDSRALLAHIDDLYGQLPQLHDRHVYLVSARAGAHLLYGEEEQALRQLGMVRWDQAAPMIQAIRANCEALRCFLCSRRYRDGLIWALKARELSSLKWWPGTGQMRRWQEMLVEVGRVLTGDATESAIPTLTRARAARNTPARVLATFALAHAYAQRGDRARSDEMRRALAELAPHCAPLHVDPLPPDANPSGEPCDVALLVAPRGGAAPAACSTSTAAPVGSFLRGFAVKLLIIVIALTLFVVLYQFVLAQDRKAGSIGEQDFDEQPGCKASQHAE